MYVINKVSWAGFLLFFIVGCAVMSQSKDEELKKINLPPKASVDIPEALNPNIQTALVSQKIQIDKEEGYAQGYLNIVRYIDFVEEITKEIKLLIPVIDKSMLEIQQECQGTQVNQVCRIESGKVSTVFDDDLLQRFRTLFQVDLQMNENITLGDQIKYGDIEFAQYDNNETYNYKLSIDFTELYALLYDINFTAAKVLQVIEWSEDNATVLSSRYSGDGTSWENSWTLSYEEEELKERMHLYDVTSDVEPFPQFTSTFTLTKLYDLNNTYYAKYNSIDNPYFYGSESRILSKFSSYTQLTNTTGYQRYVTSDVFDNEESLYREDSVFDNFGKLLALTYCSEDDEECSIENPDSWYSDAEDEAIFNPIGKLAVDFIPLTITGGNLKNEGSYFLLPADLNLSEMSIDEVVVSSVGEFIAAYDTTQGILYKDTYSDNLDRLQVVYSQYNDEVSISLAQRTENLFELVEPENRPSIELALPKP